MAECIERETFLKDIEERYCLPCKEAGKDHNGCKCDVCWVGDIYGDVGEVIDAPAADVAPVVRCKDCLYWERDTGFCHYHSRYYDGGASWDIFFNEDDFCSYGERNEND